VAANEIPGRVHRLAEARQRFGDLPDRMIPFLWRSDPLADEAARELAEVSHGEADRRVEHALSSGSSAIEASSPALARLVEAMAHVPFWVDWARIDRAGLLLFRAGPLGPITLAAKALLLGYASPAGNKPLALSGRLTTGANRRLGETGQYLVAVCGRDGLRPKARSGKPGEGFASSLRVRLLHARIRGWLEASGKWRSDRWGAPLNQHDMVGTLLMFSSVFLDGVRELGLGVSAKESSDWMHLWRYAGWLMGVDPELLPASEEEGRRIGELILATQAPPDEDSRTLARALLEAPREIAGSGVERALAEVQVIMGRGFARVLVGDEVADALGVPYAPSRLVGSLTRTAVRTLEQLRRFTPIGETLAVKIGRAYWDHEIARSLAVAPSHSHG
jgi:hypothetical protein